MEPLGDKNLLEFCGEPLVLKLLKNAQKGGLKNFIVVTNKDNKKEVATILQKAKFPAEITTQKDLKQGMAGGVSDGLKLVKNDESVFILGGNDYFDSRVFSKILKTAKGLDGAILAKKITEYFPGGYLQVSCKNSIKQIIEKPTKGKEPSDLINIVAHFFQKAGELKTALKTAKSSRDDVYEVALQTLFSTKKFVAVEYEGTWQAIKYPWHVLELVEIFLKEQKTSISKKASIDKSAQIKGDGVVIETGVRLFSNAVVQGPCYLGKNVIIGNNALVRNSMLGESSSAGYNTEIARSYFSSNVTSHIAYIGDSVVDQGVNFGAFSCTANLRLDKKPVKVLVKKEKIDSKHKTLGAIVGKGAQIGIHAMLMPGCKIPPEDFVKPGEIRK